MANNTRTLVNNNFGRRKENTKYFSVFFSQKKNLWTSAILKPITTAFDPILRKHKITIYIFFNCILLYSHLSIFVGMHRHEQKHDVHLLFFPPFKIQLLPIRKRIVLLIWFGTLFNQPDRQTAIGCASQIRVIGFSLCNDQRSSVTLLCSFPLILWYHFLFSCLFSQFRLFLSNRHHRNISPFSAIQTNKVTRTRNGDVLIWITDWDRNQKGNQGPVLFEQTNTLWNVFGR